MATYFMNISQERRDIMTKRQSYFGFIGFMGFMSMRYFSSGNLLDLSYIGFFGFFSYFIIAKISGNKEDERYIKDRNIALAFTGKLAVVELSIIWCATMLIRNIDFICVLLALTYAITINAYAKKLYILEEK